MSRAAHSASACIVDDKERGIFRVHRSAFTDAGIFELERRHIFDVCWLYLGHESEVDGPGAFISRTVAGRPLIMTRDREGALHVFFNTCPHRGALVCREESGTTRTFTCPYHAWVFDYTGRTISRPLPESYSEDCANDPSLNLQPVPRFEQYAGFVFVNFSEQGMSLADYLADAKPYLDDIQAQDRERMVIVGGTQTYSARANWKLLQENSADGYHATATHATYFDYIRNREGTVKNLYANKGLGRVRNLGNGHAVGESVDGTPWGRPLARWIASWGNEVKQEVDAAYREMADRLGEERARIICHGDRNLLIFPNLVINDIMGMTVRTYYPVSPDYFEVNAWALAPKNESPVLRDLRLSNYLEFLGPAGFATPDDQEMLELCQRAYASTKWVQWNDLSRGMETEDGDSPPKQDELQMRTFWRRWRDLIEEGERGADGSAPVELAHRRATA